VTTNEDFGRMTPEEQVELLKGVYRWDSDDVSIFDRQCPGHMRESFYKHDKTLVALLAPQSHERGLDVGCGCGRVEAQWASRVLSLHGVDFSKAAIEIARREVNEEQGITNALFSHNDGRTLHFKDGVFDFAWCEQVFQHVPRDITLGYLKEIARVLKPGGRFVCQIPSIAKYNNSWDCGGMSEELVEEMLTQAGFASWEFAPPDGPPGAGVCPTDDTGEPFYIVPLCTR
jgi:ubiquinone/menaquinone biosynthesis C-methylase UbiE